MKNIHILPTDKPSRLYKLLGKELKSTTKYFEQKALSCINQHIYITSDEEIKEGDWVYDGTNNPYLWTDGDVEDCLYNLGATNYKGCKKIILTTDQDLIKDGVQAIDDSFLEWFVKNPSCEEVEVEIEPMFPMYSTFIESIDNPPFYGNLKRKIIIPKEEPKFVTVNIESATGEDLGKVSYIPLPNVDYIPKQETLEEAAEMYADKQSDASMRKDPLEYSKSGEELWDEAKTDFIEGAKWMQERMYSEEDMIKFAEFIATYPDKNKNVNGEILHAKSKYDGAERTIDLLQKWFEQFKNK